MPTLNPKRVLTPLGKRTLIQDLTREDFTGMFGGALVFPLVACDVDPVTNALISPTKGVTGLQTGVALGMLVGAFETSPGKPYCQSDVLTWTLATPTGPQTVVGLCIAAGPDLATALAYLEFDDAVTLDENGEKLRAFVEWGFDGDTFYILPRHVPAGM